MIKQGVYLAGSRCVFEGAELLGTLALPHDEVLGELEHVEDELLKLDPVDPFGSHSLTICVAVERNLLPCDVIRQKVVEEVTNFVKKLRREEVVANVARVIRQFAVAFSSHLGISIADLAVLYHLLTQDILN